MERKRQKFQGARWRKGMMVKEEWSQEFFSYQDQHIKGIAKVGCYIHVSKS